MLNNQAEECAGIGRLKRPVRLGAFFGNDLDLIDPGIQRPF